MREHKRGPGWTAEDRLSVGTLLASTGRPVSLPAGCTSSSGDACTLKHDQTWLDLNIASGDGGSDGTISRNWGRRDQKLPD